MLQPEDFQPHLGQVFLAHLPEGGEPVPLHLKTVQLHAERTQTWLRNRPFTLHLRGPAARALHPGNYLVVWPDDSQRQTLFMQLVMGSGPHGAHYEAIFN
jgi:hypothetical protein